MKANKHGNQHSYIVNTDNRSSVSTCGAAIHPRLVTTPAPAAENKRLHVFHPKYMLLGA